MIIWVVKFPSDGYKISLVFGKNHHTQIKLLYFVNGHSASCQKVPKFDFSFSIFYVKYYLNFSDFFKSKNFNLGVNFGYSYSFISDFARSKVLFGLSFEIYKIEISFLFMKFLITSILIPPMETWQRLPLSCCALALVASWLEAVPLGWVLLFLFNLLGVVLWFVTTDVSPLAIVVGPFECRPLKV